MNQKLIPLIVLATFVLIVGTLSFWGFKILKETKPRDELGIILYDLKWKTGIEFSEVEESELKWKAKSQEKIEERVIESKFFEARHILSDEQSKIKSFLESEGFQLDIYNVSVGLSSGTIGYKRGNVACLVEGETILNENGLPADPVKIDMKISCGLVEAAT